MQILIKGFVIKLNQHFKKSLTKLKIAIWISLFKLLSAKRY
jgi:hypothetical protein